MRARLGALVFGGLSIAVAAIACVGDGSSSPVLVAEGGTPGKEGQACFENGTCDDGLTCVSMVCVRLGTDGATSDGMSLAESGAEATDGATDGSADAPVDAPSRPACESDPGAAFSKKLSPPTTMPGSCTTAQLTQFSAACFSATASGTACGMWVGSNATCAACMISQRADASWGAFVNYPIGAASQLFPNSSGCEKLVTGDQTCTQQTQDRIDCTNAACVPCAGTSDLNACLFGPSTPTCAALPKCAAMTDANDPCLVGGSMDPLTIALAYGTRFCG